MKIGIFGNEYQKKDQIIKILDLLARNGVDIFLHHEFHSYILSEFGLEYKVAGVIDDDNFDLDMAFSVGGDGTFLRTVSLIQGKNIPILGINTGRLGFLADVSESDMEQTMSEILNKQYKIEERTQLKLSLDGPIRKEGYALNEIAILKQDSASMITICSHINNELLTKYEADGLIIATPTGSTAYSLSVGGPIMAPNTSNLIITAIAPHSLSTRPLVIEDDNVLTMKVYSRNNSFLISLDGRSETLPSDGTIIRIEKAETSVKVIKRLGHTFYETLKNKLKWGDTPRGENF